MRRIIVFVLVLHLLTTLCKPGPLQEKGNYVHFLSIKPGFFLLSLNSKTTNKYTDYLSFSDGEMSEQHDSINRFKRLVEGSRTKVIFKVFLHPALNEINCSTSSRLLSFWKKNMHHLCGF